MRKALLLVLSVTVVATLPPLGCGGKTNNGSGPPFGGPDGSSVDASTTFDASASSSGGGGYYDAGNGSTPDSSYSQDAPNGGPANWDAALANGTIQDASFDVAPAPTGEAGFAFVVNGVVQTPMKCIGHDWQFPFVPGEEPDGGPAYPPVPGVDSVVIVNTGTLPMPYLAQSYWSAGQNVPGGATGQTYQLAGVLEVGEQVDITAVYLPGYVALLGSAEPFSSEDAAYAADEGTIPWPPGIPGSGGASTMYIAQIVVPYSPPSQCSAEYTQMW